MDIGDHLSSSSLSSCLFSCRIVDISSALVPPIKGLDVRYSELSGSPVKKVPILRIFGATPVGQKCCLHVHGAFPYLYVPFVSETSSDRYLIQLGQSIDCALTVSLGSSADEHHVFKMNIVTGIPFYGYYSKEKLFLKIYLYNPANIKRLSDLLLSGAVMNTVFQPHESHIPFPLQFMIDYNLYGMNFINTSAVRFRIKGDASDFCNPPPWPPPPATTTHDDPLSPSTSIMSTSSILLNPSQRSWNMEALADDMFISEARVSSSELEADLLATDILNREELQLSSGRFPGLTALWEEEQVRRETLGIEAPLSQPPSPARFCNIIHAAESCHKDQFEKIINSRKLSLEPVEDIVSPLSSPQSSFLYPLSQSCDVEIHELIESPVKNEVQENIDIIVDEELLQKKMEIHKKLSAATLDTSDIELLDTLAELADQPSKVIGSVSPSSQSTPSHLILSQVLRKLSSETKDGDSNSGSTKFCTERGIRDISSPIGSDFDLFEDLMVKMKDVTKREARSPSAVSTNHSYLDDTIPCNQYADKGSDLSAVNESIVLDTDLLNRSSRSHTPIVSEDTEMAVINSPPLQFPMRQLSFKEKRELIKICSDLSAMEENDNGSTLGEEDSDDDDETESIMMSHILLEQESELVLKTDQDELNKNIPQFDGPGGDSATNKTRRGRRISLKCKRKDSSKVNPSDSRTTDSAVLQHQPTHTQATTDTRTTDSAVLQHQPATHTQATTDPNIDVRERHVSRALSGSLVPLVRKLSKEESEKYLQPTTVSQIVPPIEHKDKEQYPSSTSPLRLFSERNVTCKIDLTPIKHKRKQSSSVTLTSKKQHIEDMYSSRSQVSSNDETSDEDEQMEMTISEPIQIGQLKTPVIQKSETEDSIDLCDSTCSSTDNRMIKDTGNNINNWPPYSDSSNNKRSFLLLESTIVESDTEGMNGDEHDEPKHHPHHQEETADDFTLVYSASETEASESEVCVSQDNNDASSLKVKDTVHWIDGVNNTSDSQLRRNELESVTKHYSTNVTPCVHVPSSPESCIITPNILPPSVEDLLQTSSLYNIPSTRHTKPFFSNPQDVQQPRDFGGTLFWVPSTMSYDLKDFSPPYVPANVASACFNYNHWSIVLTTSNTFHSLDHPKCYPEIRNGKTRHLLYTAADHNKDIKTRSLLASNTACVITPIKAPPDPQILHQWIKDSTNQFCLNKHRTLSDSSSLLEGPSLDNTYGFKITPEKDQNILVHVDSHFEYVTLISLEIHVQTRLGLKPDPEWDSVLVICYTIQNDWEPSIQRTGLIAIDMNVCSNIGSPVKQKVEKISRTPVKKSPMKAKASPKKQQQENTKSSRLNSATQFKNFTSIFLHDPSQSSATSTNTTKDKHPFLYDCGLSPDLTIIYVKNESELFDELIKLVTRVDPDFLIGYEVELSSLGYLKDRASHLGINLFSKLARIPLPLTKRPPPPANNSSRRIPDLHIVGRIVLNLWRLLKPEVSLMNYSFENVCFHTLYKRVPQFTHQTLTDWYQYKNSRHRVIDYYMIRCHGNLELIDRFNLIGRTSEMARLYGIEFQSCLSKGSQYRVESMMLRLAKPANYIAVSPSVYQRAKMAAPECLPLILEPESKFYSDPVLLLDFQSLYPSMIIGYNYCFSTCLGRVKNLSADGDYKFGTCSLSISAAELERLKDNVTISPNGIVFLKPCVREGILPRMLTEILNTRIMVKQSMKLHKNNKKLLKMLDARQLCLKLIANVTYGYAGASYSGRMPCVEVADSVVRKGRETLERAIDLVQSNSKWKAKVVYGDTDSLFVLLKGVTKDEAFRIGNEMCQAVTNDNPKPIKLKFEKVYLPCLLQTKKRYVGFSYESSDQKEPSYDAKGIETVRRDGCPAVGKILEKCLHLLFSSRDLSTVKSYFQYQCTKIMKGQVSLQDFTFAKEYRGQGGYRPGACVPALELSRQGLSVDRRSEPRVGERVPYVIVYGGPGLPLIQLVRRPEELLTNTSLRLNSVYYITKQILPALDRGLALVGVDVFQWYNELPKIKESSLSTTYPALHPLHKNTIGQYFPSMHCLICNEVTSEYICKQCKMNPSNVTIQLSTDIHRAQDRYFTICKLCENCCGSADSKYYLECISLDCPVLYIRQSCLKRYYSKDANQYLLHQ